MIERPWICCASPWWPWLQYLREKNFKQTIPPVRIEDDEEITYEKATDAVRRCVSFWSALQSDHGHWPAENAGPIAFYFPPLVSRRFRSQNSYFQRGCRWICLVYSLQSMPILSGEISRCLVCTFVDIWTPSSTPSIAEKFSVTFTAIRCYVFRIGNYAPDTTCN